MKNLKRALLEAEEKDYDWESMVEYLDTNAAQVRQVIMNSADGSVKTLVEGIKVNEGSEFLSVEGRNLKASLNKKGFMHATLVKKEFGVYYASANILFVLG